MSLQNVHETKIDKLRNQLIELRKERDKAVLEKGLSAQDNKDLRENATYDYWEQKEHQLTSRILNIIKEIETLTKS